MITSKYYTLLIIKSKKIILLTYSENEINGLMSCQPPDKYGGA